MEADSRVLASSSADPFDAGPWTWSPRLLHLEHETVAYRMLLTALVGWVPLVVLAALEGLALRDQPRMSFLLDLAAHARYLVAAPLFIWAAFVYVPQLAYASRHFLSAGLIADADLPRYYALVDSTRRLLASRWVDALIVGVAYAWTVAASPLQYPTTVPTWIAPASAATGHMSLAGWWRTLVSQPLFLALFCGWLWRLALWTRFLWTVASMDLQLVAAHPDQRGGLQFVLSSQRGFGILAFALGAVAAGTVGESVLVEGQSLGGYGDLIIAQVLVVLMLFAAPLLLLMRSVLHLKERGIFEYGRLASQLGRQFEQRWVGPAPRPVDGEALAATDFSATTDLFAIVANVRAINVLLLDLRNVAWIAAATLLPYIPVVLMVIPVDQAIQFVLRAFT